MKSPKVITSLDVLCRQGFAALRGLRIGLVTHPAAVNSDLRHVGDLLAEAPGVNVAAIFGPEHGLLGEAQDLERIVGSGQWVVGSEEVPPGSILPTTHHPLPTAARSGVPTYSLYGSNVDSLKPTQEQLAGLDALVIDLEDVGSRYYTFQATMLYCLEAASEHRLLTVILDRPNPLGGETVEGPALSPGFESFVGCHPIATRHGMTIAELARMYAKEKSLSGELKIIPCEGLIRGMDFDDTGLAWVLPSPNMPTVETAFVYPGQCLLEGTNLSEGRGTTKPFELCGAPWIEPKHLAARLSEEKLPGVTFRPTYFKPTFQKFAGQACGGVQLHVRDRREFHPVRTGLTVLAAMRELSGSHFRWRTEPYEFVADRPAIDLLFGSDRERLGLDRGREAGEIAKAWKSEEEEFRERRKPFLLY